MSKFTQALVHSLCAALASTGLLSSAAKASSEIWFQYATGFDYSRGDYGIDRETEVVYVPFSVEANYGMFRGQVTLPFIWIDGPTAIALDANDNETGTDSKAIDGLGQITARVGYFVAPFHEAAPWFEFSTRMTAPSESDDSLGSGKWAFSLQADAFKRYGRVTPFTRFGRTFYTGTRLDDRLYASIGSSFQLTDKISIGISYDWFEATISGISDTQDFVGFASMSMGKLWSFGPYGLAGLSKSSPDYGIGFSFTYRPSGW
jgi:hypothetical protein